MMIIMIMIVIMIIITTISFESIIAAKFKTTCNNLHAKRVPEARSDCLCTHIIRSLSQQQQTLMLDA